MRGVFSAKGPDSLCGGVPVVYCPDDDHMEEEVQVRVQEEEEEEIGETHGEEQGKEQRVKEPKSSPYLQRSLVLDSGHLLVQVPKRSGILWKRIAHKEFGIISRTRCCWNSQRADALFSVQRLHCPGVSSKAKDTENCRYILLQVVQQLRLFFA